ncbi:unnamed protein product [Arctogadus glacialis]
MQMEREHSCAVVLLWMATGQRTNAHRIDTRGQRQQGSPWRWGSSTKEPAWELGPEEKGVNTPGPYRDTLAPPCHSLASRPVLPADSICPSVPPTL